MTAKVGKPQVLGDPESEETVEHDNRDEHDRLREREKKKQGTSTIPIGPEPKT